MKKLLVFGTLVFAAWYYFHDPAGEWRGIPAAQDPQQTSAAVPPAFDHDGYTITPLARYDITAVVLSRSRYRNDADAKLAPVDLALGWGPMSVSGVINNLNISQSGRWYEYSWSDDPPLDPAQITRHSANTHCLPATAEVKQRLLAVKRHELVSLQGYLVEVSKPDGYRWRSSLSRDDMRGGSCEVMWITAVSSRKL
ncbi:MAG TPA: hypothetical protein VL069_14525 [Opitutus sp.]|nr:hypothetical protein [Opitutus sp.]